MIALFDGAMFLGIALLAMVVPAFVLSVSLLGRAAEHARKQRERAETRRQAEVQQRIEELEAQLEIAKKTGNVDEVSNYESDLGKLAKEHKRSIRRIERSTASLTVTGAVAVPGSLFLAGAALSAIARTLEQVPLFSLPVSLGLIPWVLALGAIAFGIVRLLQCLRVVQMLALGSEEAALRRMIAAFKKAQEELDEERAPAVALAWRRPPPFEVKAGRSTILEYRLSLSKGRLAEKVETWFFAPDGFDFPDADSWLQDDTDSVVGKHVTTKRVVEAMIPSTQYIGTLKVKAQLEEGVYICYYRVKCPVFVGDLISFEIHVEPGEVEVPF